MIAYSAPSARPAIRISNDPCLSPYTTSGGTSPSSRPCAHYRKRAGTPEKESPLLNTWVDLGRRLEAWRSLDLPNECPVVPCNLVHAQDLVGRIAVVVKRHASGSAAVVDVTHVLH